MIKTLACAYTHYSVPKTCYSPKQMGSKAKHGAKGPAKANAKASIAKAEAGGLAKAKSKAKEASSSNVYKGAGHQGWQGLGQHPTRPAYGPTW